MWNRRCTFCLPHAEGRGFESHQPLPRRPAFAGLFCGGSRLVRLRRRVPHWVAAASRQRGASESGSFAGHLWELEPVSSCGAKPHHGVGVGVHLARDRVADDRATPSGVAGGRLPATAFAHEQSRWEHRSTRLRLVRSERRWRHRSRSSFQCLSATVRWCAWRVGSFPCCPTGPVVAVRLSCRPLGAAARPGVT